VVRLSHQTTLVGKELSAAFGRVERYSKRALFERIALILAFCHERRPGERKVFRCCFYLP
jgi:hypothetical protein